jgi:hypothetical protein
VAGIGLLAYFIRRILLATGIGPTLVEISQHPLFPGARCKLLLSQAGRLKVNWIELLLVSDEQSTYRQGTDTRTETRRVFQRQVFRREDIQINPGMPFEVQCDLEIPDRVMHSFRSNHNEISWKLVARGEAAGWPPYERAFPVIVYPVHGSTDA